ncbi:E3 ubiquitin-protein ligase ATL6-like [Bidens hawaiensis]|uniref:E3 ubiquitin-protein ligase ATL6-like n=1 Tax=Bidens hawaiensis TaxID=980011 RepID=UPI00404A4CFA
MISNQNIKSWYIGSPIQPFFVVLFVLQLLLPHVRSQNSPPPPSGYPYADFNPSIITIIVILVAALFLMGFFSIYIRRRSNEGVSLRGALSIRRVTAASRGLDSSIIETFPTFVYSSVKEHKIGKGALECAVCLNEYEDEETLRLIPKCDHVFHPECIDAWFENHVTCPVCRADLVPDPAEAGDGVGVARLGDDDDQRRPTDATGDGNMSANDDHVSISVVEEEEVNAQDPAPATLVTQPVPPESLNRDQSVKSNRPPLFPRLFDKFRSHSTGHSLVQPGENLDRFTLRLPVDVRKQVVNRALLNRVGSTTRMVGEGSGKTGYRTAGALSGRRKPYKRLESLDRVVVRSERWVLSRAPSFLSRALSIRSPRIVTGNGEGSTSSTTPKGSKTEDKIPLNNLGPKSC